MMNKQQYKQACHIFRTIQLIEDLIPNSSSSEKYLRHQHKSLCLELSSIDRHWIAKEHTEEMREFDKYDDLWWLWFKFPMHMFNEIKEGLRGDCTISNRTRKRIRAYLASKAVA